MLVSNITPLPTMFLNAFLIKISNKIQDCEVKSEQITEFQTVLN